MTRRAAFKDKEDFKKFCDGSMFCVCNRLMTGLHMSGCSKLRKIATKFDAVAYLR